MIDPWNIRRLFPFVLCSTLGTAHYPFFYAASFLIIFFWFELLNNSVFNTTAILGVYKLPAGIIIGLIFIMEIICDVLRAKDQSSIPILISAGVYATVCIGCMLAYLITGGTLLSRLRGSSTENRRSFRKISMLMIAGGIGYFLVFIFSVMPLTPLFQMPQANFYIVITFYLVPSLLSIIHAIAFEPPNQLYLSRFLSFSSDDHQTTIRSMRSIHGNP